MRVRIIERNDGWFQYEVAVVDISKSKNIRWDRCEYARFRNENDARKHAIEIIKFLSSSETKNVLDEIDVGEL